MVCRLTACLLAVTALSSSVYPGDGLGVGAVTGRAAGNISVAVDASPAADAPTVQSLLILASRYVATFVDRFSNVVAEEHYVQDWKTNTGIQLVHRELTSDFLLTRTSLDQPWQAFRDVFSVNGTPIRDREDRLTRLFINASPEAMTQAAAIATESARYNVSNVQRTINQPLVVFILLQAENQKRLTCSVDKQDREAGDNIWIVDFKETARPTIVRGPPNRDLPAHGRFWIHGVDGRIVRTELQFEDNQQSARITARFKTDELFQIDVPFEMEEQYSVKGSAGKITAKATYGRFREWQVKTSERVK